jgi:hypothetical protein
MTYLKDLFQFLSKEISEGKTRFCLVANDRGQGVIESYIHPLGKNGETFDFSLSDFGTEVQIMSNPEAARVDSGKALQGIEAEPMLQFFNYHHLPDHLKQVSAPFAALAIELISSTPRNPERTTALRKLLEAKDCAVRAVIYK